MSRPWRPSEGQPMTQPRKKNKYIGLRLDSDMYKDLQDIAEYNGLSISQLVRRFIAVELRNMNVEEELIYETISKV